MSLSHWVGKQFKIAFRLVLWLPCLRTICFSLPIFYAVFVSLWPLYYSDGDILSVLLRQRLIMAVPSIFSFTSVVRFAFFAFHLLFCPGSFRSLSCSCWVFSDHCRNPSLCCFTQQLIYKMSLSAITFVIDVDISLYSSLHSVENV